MPNLSYTTIYLTVMKVLNINEIKEVSNGYECDVQLLVVLDEFNNVDLREV